MPGQTHSAGNGAHGPRMYSWAWFRLLAEDDTDTGVHHLLIRRNDATGELAYLRCYSPSSAVVWGLHNRGDLLAALALGSQLVSPTQLAHDVFRGMPLSRRGGGFSGSAGL